MVQFLGFVIALAITLMLIGIGATHGFSFEVYIGMALAGAKFIIESIKMLSP